MCYISRVKQRRQDINKLYRYITEPESREALRTEAAQEQEGKTLVLRIIFVLVLGGVAFLWLMNALGHPL
jgi:hypothetical protein